MSLTVNKAFGGAFKNLASGMFERGYYDWKKIMSKEGAERAATIHHRSRNILAAKAVADDVRTSLGPQGMDKMIQV